MYSLNSHSTSVMLQDYVLRPESTALGLDLPVQLVVGHKVDVLNPGKLDHWHGKCHEIKND